MSCPDFKEAEDEENFHFGVYRPGIGTNRLQRQKQSTKRRTQPNKHRYPTIRGGKGDGQRLAPRRRRQEDADVLGGMMTSKEFSKTVENVVQVFIASWIIAYALLRLKAQPSSLGDWMMLIVGALIIGYANWSYRRRRAARERER